MKPIIQKIWMLMAMLFAFLPASAYDFEVDGIRYNVLSHIDYTVETTISPNVIIGEDGVLSIPEMVKYGTKELKVTKIGDKSFMSLLGISAVEISNYVEIIGDYAFSNCTNLTALSAEKIKVVCPHAFEGCIKLTNLILGDEVSEVKEYSFASCSSLRSFCYENNLQVIGDYAFSNSGLQTFTIGDKLLELGQYAFTDCKNLVSVDFPDNIIDLTVGIFKGCDSLTNLNNFSVPSILPLSCFQNCQSLNISDILESSTLETISSYSLSGCVYPDAISLRKNIKNIGDYILQGFEGNLDIVDSYNTLNVTKQSFSGMNIVRLRLGRNLSSWNFHFPSSIISLNIGPCVSEIAPKIEVNPGNSYYSGYTYGGAPFVECYNLASIEIEASSSPLFISGIGKQIDYNHIGGDYQDWYYTYSYSGVFSECPITDLKILRPINSDNGTSYTFKRSTKYYDYTTYKWQDPFHGVASVNSLYVDYNAFEFAPITPALKNLYISFYVDEIPDLSICDLESISIKTSYPPAAIGFSSKTYMDCRLNIPPGEQQEYERSKIWSNFWNTTELHTLLCCIRDNGLLYHIVGDEKLALIKDRILYVGDVSIPDEIEFEGNYYTVSGIEKNAFKDCADLRSLKVSGSVIEFGEFAFSGCTSLHTIHFDNSENTLSFPPGNFDHTSSTQSKTVNGKTVRFAISYYNGYFSGLPLTELYLGRNLSDDSRYFMTHDGYKYIITQYDGPFCNLPKLETLSIGNRVSVLGPREEFIKEVELYCTPGSFKTCANLNNVSVSNSVPPTGAEFSNTAYSKASLVVPDNTISLYEVADGWKEFVNILDETSAGLDEVSANEKDGSISVNVDGITYIGNSIENVSVYSMDGRLIHSTVVGPNKSIALSNGLYIIRIKNKSFKVKI